METDKKENVVESSKQETQTVAGNNQVQSLHPAPAVQTMETFALSRDEKKED